MNHVVINAKHWGDILDFYESHKENFVFRGLSSDVPLMSTLERVRESYSLAWADLHKYELESIREFQRRYHFYSSRSVDIGDYSEWLALMRHNGAPTRLLDWSYSLFVAAHFALERMSSGARSVIWAINVNWLRDKGRAAFRKWVPDEEQGQLQDYDDNRSGESFRRVFMRDDPVSFVYTVNPFYSNPRLTAQQGLFLCPGDIHRPFEDNLASLPESDEQVFKVVIDPGCHEEGLEELYRMNLDSATLFPDLEGYAKSLWTRIPRLSKRWNP